jgi:hypothetical protein
MGESMKAKVTISPVLVRGISRTWSAIGGDMAACCAEMGERLTNSGAMESVLDADRLLAYDPEAHRELEELMKNHSFNAVSRAICRKVRLV